MYLSVPGGYKSVPGSHLRFLAVIWDMANYINIELIHYLYLHCISKFLYICHVCANQIWTKCELCWFKLASVTPSLLLSGTHQGVPGCRLLVGSSRLPLPASQPNSLIFCNLLVTEGLQSRVSKDPAAIWIFITNYHWMLHGGIIHAFITGA